MQASGSRLIACMLKHLFCSLFPFLFSISSQTDGLPYAVRCSFLSFFHLISFPPFHFGLRWFVLRMILSVQYYAQFLS